MWLYCLRKVMSIEYSCLMALIDGILIGSRSLADCLGGGDLDG